MSGDNTKEGALPGKAEEEPATAVMPDQNAHRHWVRLASFVALWFAVLLYAVVIAKALPAKATQWDFSIYYASATILRQQRNPYHLGLQSAAAELGLETWKIDRATDPPTFLLCLEPLTLLRPRPAFWVWTGLNIAALIAALVVLLRRERELTIYATWMIVGLAIFYPAVGDHLVWGQSKLLLLLILALMLHWMDRGNDAAAGLSLAAAGLLRVYPLLLIIYLLLIGRLRAIIWCAIGLAAGGLITLDLVGFDACRSFFLGLPYFSEKEWTTLLSNISVTAVVSRVFLRLHPLMTPAYDIARRALSYAAALLVLGFTIRATRIARSRSDNVGSTFALWIATALMLSPLAWPIDLVLLLIALVEIAAAASRGEVNRRILCAGISSYVALWVFYICENIYFNYLASHQQSLAWTIGAFPAALLAYIAIYWFASDQPPAVGAHTPLTIAPMITVPADASAPS